MSKILIPFNLFCPDRDFETWQELCVNVLVLGEYSYAHELMTKRGYLWTQTQHAALVTLFDEQLKQDVGISNPS